MICSAAWAYQRDLNAGALFDGLPAKPGIIIVDPPRKGLDSGLIKEIAGASPGSVVYISCDPATLSRDIKIFGGLGYKAVSAKAVDMFPRTKHVEVCCLLKKTAGIL